MKTLKRSGLSKFFGLAGSVCCLPVAAQVSDPGSAWQFEVTPYLWLSTMPLRVDVGASGSNGTIPPFPVFHTGLDFAGMGAIEARKGPWGALMDVQYVKLGVTGSPEVAALTPFSNLDLTYTQQIWTFLGLYRLADGPVSVDLLGGARYLHAKTDLEVSALSLPGTVGGTRSKGWWDGVVGGRALLPLDEKWSLLGYLDVGGGGSEVSWQAIAGANYRYSNATTFKFGYRYFHFKRDDAPVLEATMGGLYAGVGFRF